MYFCMQCILVHVGTAGTAPHEENTAILVIKACSEEFIC